MGQVLGNPYSTFFTDIPVPTIKLAFGQSNATTWRGGFPKINIKNLLLAWYGGKTGKGPVVFTTLVRWLDVAGCNNLHFALRPSRAGRTIYLRFFDVLFVRWKEVLG